MTITAKYPGRCRTCGERISVGEEIEWSRDDGARHVQCPAEAPPDPDAIHLHGGSGYGCRGWQAGQVVRFGDKRVEAGGPRWVVITRAEREYVRDVGMCFGVGDDDGYLYHAEARPATPEEFAEREAEHDTGVARRAAQEELAAIYHEIVAPDHWVQGEDLPKPEGKVVPIGRQDLRIYGTGDSLVVTDDWVYAMELCGADGDAWNGNFGATCRGWRIPADADLVKRIQTAHELTED